MVLKGVVASGFKSCRRDDDILKTHCFNDVWVYLTSIVALQDSLGVSIEALEILAHSAISRVSCFQISHASTLYSYIYIYVYNRVYTCILYMRTHIHIIHLYTYLLACQVCQVCFLCSQVRYDSRQKHHSVFISTSVAPHPQFDTRTSLFEVRILGEPEAVQAARRRFFDTLKTLSRAPFFFATFETKNGNNWNGWHSRQLQFVKKLHSFPKEHLGSDPKQQKQNTWEAGWTFLQQVSTNAEVYPWKATWQHPDDCREG